MLKNVYVFFLKWGGGNMGYVHVGYVSFFCMLLLYLRWHWIMIMIGYHRYCPFLAAEVS